MQFIAAKGCIFTALCGILFSNKMIKIFYAGFTRIIISIQSAIWKYRFSSMGDGTRVSGKAVIYQASAMKIGSGCVVNDFVHIWAGGGVVIGNDVLIAAHTVITSVTHDRDAVAKGKKYSQTRVLGPVVIGDNVWIGSSVVIVPGVTIGDNAIVGAGSVVTKNVRANSVVMGVPAREKF